MGEFEAKLSAFLAGEAEFAELESALVRALGEDPSIAPAAFAAVDRLYRAGRLPLQLYSVLKKHIAQRASDRAPSTTGSRGGAAQSGPRRREPPGGAPADPTGASRTSGHPTGMSSAAAESGSDHTIVRLKPTHGTDPSRHAAAPTGRAPHDARQTAGQPGPPPGDLSLGTSGRTGSSTSASSWTDFRETGGPPPSMERGSVLKGRFVLENVLGRGGMGVVFKARDLRKEEAQDRNPYVAVKILNDEFRRHPESLKALQRETRKTQDLAHPNIVNVFDFDRDGAIVFMTMEYLEGESLDRIIRAPHFAGYSLKEALPIIEGLVNALGYAHRKGIVHSDFKPGNCFLTTDGTVKVFDFGIAKAVKLKDVDHVELTRFDPNSLGALTLAYASLEMIEGSEPDPRDDVYALGCVVYELLSGKHPFGKRSVEEALRNAEARNEKLEPARIKGLSSRQWRTLRKALALRREDRLSSVDELLEGLKQQKPIVPLAAAAVAILAVALIAYFGHAYWQERQRENLIAALVSRDEVVVSAALERLRELDPQNRNEIWTDDVSTQVRQWFVDEVDATFNEAAGRYDYPRAVRLLDQADEWFPDSNVLNQRRARLEERRDNLLNELGFRFNDAIENGRLLPRDDEDDVFDVLEIVAQLQPDDRLLGAGEKLAFAYSDAAAAALDERTYGSAQQLLLTGLTLFPQDGRLRNLMDRLDAELLAERNAQRAAELSARLDASANAASYVELVALAQAAAELADLSPDEPALAGYRERLLAALDGEMTSMLDGRRWEDAERLIDAVSTVLAENVLRERRSRIVALRDAYTAELNGLLARLDAAADERRLEDAVAAFRALEALPADERTLADAQSAVVQTYLLAAQQSANARRFDEAESIVALALEFAPASERLAEARRSLEEQRRLAELQDEQQREQQRLATARELRERIDRYLELETPTIEATELAMAAAEGLELVADDDPRAGRAGRQAIAEKLAEYAEALGDGGRHAEALAFLESVPALLRGMPSIERVRGELRAEQERALLAERFAALDALLDSPRIDTAGAARLREMLEGIRSVVGTDDARLAAAEERAVLLFVNQADRLREGESFEQADEFIRLAAGLAPGHSAVSAARETLDAARAAWERANAEARRGAEIEALKANFTRAANALATSDAERFYEQLRRMLPAEDEFLISAPSRIAQGYLSSARNALAGGEADRAEQFIEKGRDWAPLPGFDALLDELRAVRLQTSIDRLSAMLEGREPHDVTRGEELLQTIIDNSGEELVAIRRELAAKAEARVREGAADADYLEWVAAVLGLDLRPARPAGGRECTDALAGYGTRSSALCFDMLTAEITGPRFVVVPAGGGFEAFAIGVVEITRGQWRDYCNLSGRCSVASDGNDNLPVTNVSVEAVEEYASWLTEVTGVTYRLPTLDEWMYAASAPRAGATGDDSNCRVPSAGRGGALRAVGNESGNVWGLKDLYGNAQEWVKTSSGYQVIGGHYDKPLERCRSGGPEAHDGSADQYTGFRLVREKTRRD